MTEDESNKAGGAHAAGGQSPSFSVTKQRSNGGISFPKTWDSLSSRLLYI
jgi:hypothetical protein